MGASLKPGSMKEGYTIQSSSACKYSTHMVVDNYHGINKVVIVQWSGNPDAIVDEHTVAVFHLKRKV